MLSAYLFASPVGVLAGGWVADRIKRRHDVFAAMCFVAIAACIGAVAVLRLPLAATGVLFAVTGLFSGMVSPSRDMLIRSMSPPGEIAKVFGFVSTGFNLGGIAAPVMFGYLLRPERSRHRVLGGRGRLPCQRVDGDDHRTGASGRFRLTPPPSKPRHRNAHRAL